MITSLGQRLLFLKKISDQNLSKKKKFQTIFLAILVVTSFLLMILRISLANRFVGGAKDLAKINEAIFKQKEENEKLLVFIREKSSLSRVSESAKDLGFVRSSQYSYITSPAKVAFGGNLTE